MFLDVPFHLKILSTTSNDPLLPFRRIVCKALMQPLAKNSLKNLETD